MLRFNTPGPVVSLALLFVTLSFASYDSAHASTTSPQIDSTLAHADAFFRAHRLDSARVLYEAVIDEHRNSLPALTGAGRVALAERDWQEALDRAKQALKLDSTNLMPYYIAAIAEREIGKGLLLRNTDWKTSRKFFEWILKRDSTFEDVLYQYALLERYDGYRDHAFELTRAQITKRPDLVGPEVGLYKLYKYYMAVMDSAEFVGWLRSQPGTLPHYFMGETFRRHGNLAAADSVLTEVLYHPGEVSPQAVRLALARVRFQQGDPDAAEAEYWRGVQDLKTDVGAALLFEDLKYIVSDYELDYFSRLDSLRLKQEFFRSFWNFRNPSLALKTNLRLQEHIRRYLYAEQHYEYYGFRTQLNNPDKLHELRFPRAFALNEEFNDMGLIYIRHGKPDDVLRANITPYDNEDALFDNMGLPRLTTLQGSPTKEARDLNEEEIERLRSGLVLSSPQQDPSESWLYNATPESPKMIFHFQRHNAAANNWRFSPSPSNETLIDDLQMWDVKYQKLLSDREITRAVVQDQIKAESKTVVNYALSTEQQTWEKKTETFHFPHAIDVFQAPDGRSLVDVSYAIPIAPLARPLPDTVRSAPVEIGFSLIDARSQNETTTLDTILVGLSHAKTGAIINLIRYIVPPEVYSISMHIRPLYADMLGIWRETIQVNDFSQPGLMVSSIQFLRPSVEKGSVVIEGVKVVQSPFRTHVRTEPLYVYFQIYHLVPDIYGTTSFETECILLPKGETDIAKGNVIYRKDKTEKEEMATQFYPIDVRSVDPGHYRLIVEVTDRKRVQTVIAEREVEIIAAD